MTRLNANAEDYLRTLGIEPPPPITPDMPPEVQSWIEMVTSALVAASNMGDPADMAEAEKGHAERTGLATDAATKFPANDQQQAAGMDQMAQQLPQMASSLAGGVAGALGGALQPLMQIPQQLAQTGQQLLQSGMSAMQQSGAGELSPDSFAGDALASDFGGAGGGGAGDIGAGGGGGGGVGAGTSPMAMLGPAATPSATTTPMAGRAAPPIAPATAAPAPTTTGGMGGMPMMPHGGMGGGGESKDNKAATKRVSVPAVKNGAPVQGRVTAPPPAPVVTKTADAKQAASRRRIVVPVDRSSERPDRTDDRNDG
ncbi:MAG: hypothetical protein HYZ38_12925 [Mycobacterium sp.]|nr:hypothetical protein [Mycobacterium sp.]